MMAKLEIGLPSATLALDRKLVRKVLRQVGQEIAATAKSLIRSSGASGRKYGQHTASAPGQAPSSLTGNLVRSMSVKPGRSGLSVSVRDSAFYSLILEAGAKGGGGRKGSRNKRGKPQTTRVMEPRPFLSTAAEKIEPTLESRVKDAIFKGIEFRAKKSRK